MGIHMEKIKRISISKRIISAFLFFAIIQSVVFMSMITFTGIRRSVYEQSYSSFNFQVVSRTKYISEELNNEKSGFIPTAKQIEQSISDYLNGEGIIYKDMSQQNIIDILEISTETLLYFLNNSKQVSGVFIYLEGESDVKDCVYIRDNAYESDFRNNESKIYVRGPFEIAKKYSCQLYHLWQPKQDFAYFYNNETADFYNKPMMNSLIDGMSAKDLYYWSRPYQVSDNDPLAITLTIPLVDENQIPYAVCGFEVSLDFLKKMLPYTELSDKSGMYIINSESIGDEKNKIISGPYAEQLLIDSNLDIKEVESDFELFCITYNNKLLPKFLCIKEEITLYEKNSIYNNENWYLYGILDEKIIKKYPSNVIRSLYISLFIVIILSISYIVIVTIKITKPIRMLSKKVSEIDPDEVIILPETNISEIDELTGAIKLLNDAVLSSASRLNTIVDMVGISIGAFEERMDENKVYLTNSLIKLLELPEGTKKINFDEWESIFNKFDHKKDEDVYRLYNHNTKTEHWLKIKMIDDGSVIRGVIMDTTDEIKELRRLEYERNYDSLTMILNRRAFIEQLTQNLKEGVYTKGALLVIDLDNLKYVNDNYGHETGDKYIILMSDALKVFENDNGLISRMAGDEFMVFIPYNYDSSSFLNYISIMLDSCKKRSISLPDKTKQRLRFSTGISWYPKDSKDVAELIKYADFAMYEAKHNIKGTIREFDINIYNKKSLLFNKMEMLDTLIDKEDINFMMQPIVSAYDGEIIAYEMLMRSDIEGISNPYEILSLARAQSKLYYIELIGFKRVISLLSDNEGIFKDKLLFFNSIPSIILRDEDWREILAKNPKSFKNLVLEITKGDVNIDTISSKAGEYVSDLGARIAIDNYGASYYNDKMIEKINPDFIKIDRSLVKNIHVDENNRHMVEKIVKYSMERRIETIAVGVETYDEMKELKEIGVKYLQGFYIAKPAYELQSVPKNVKMEICSLNDD